MSHRRVRFALPLGWRGRTDVQRVELYTLGTLHVMFWFLLAVGVLNGVAVLTTRSAILLMVVASAALGWTGATVLRAAAALYPEHRPIPVRPLLVLAVVALAVQGWILTLPADERFPATLVLVGVLAWACGGLRDSVIQSVVVLLGGAVALLSTQHPGMAVYGAAVAAFFVFTVQSSLWLLGVVTELDQARRSQAALAVAEERLRFSRDVHDVLGRHLATIAVRAELAATLAERHDARAPELVRELRTTAHEALREARELARGYRPLDLSQELDGAVALLRSAGIDATASLDGLPEGWHEAVARVVREAVTNVLRHSSATRVEICYADGLVEIRNDGVAAPAGHEDDGGTGTGLATLAADLAARGASLERAAASGEFVLRLRLDPATPPTPASALVGSRR
ncbi:sensor histidine kinase [Nocardioides ferulae]|uniref:sensor histidine kinase n=1 Tax=Nocardioides ferulae TaxID=2340821 RepID=UPI000EB05F4C|nr:histidine kinase [Nocardioides ferulae]